MLGSTAVVHNPLADVDVLGPLESREREIHQVSILKPLGICDIKSAAPLPCSGTTALKGKQTVCTVEDDTHVDDHEPASTESNKESDTSIQVSPTSSPLPSDRNIHVSLQPSPKPIMTPAPTSTSFIPEESPSPEDFSQSVVSASPTVDAASSLYLISEAEESGQDPTKRLRKKGQMIAQPDLTASRAFFSSDMWDLQNGSNLRTMEEHKAADVPTVRRRSLSDVYQPAVVDCVESYVDGSPLPGVMKKSVLKKRSLSGVSQPDLIGLRSWAPVRMPILTHSVDSDEQFPIEIPDVTPRWENIDTLKLLSPITESKCGENDGHPSELPVQPEGPSPCSDVSAPIDSIQTPVTTVPFDREEINAIEPVQPNGLSPSSGACSPINSIEAPFHDKATEEENGQSGESPIQQNEPIESTYESSPILPCSPLSHEAVPFDLEENDVHPLEPVECSPINGPIEWVGPNSIQTPLPHQLLSLDREENDGLSGEPVEPNRLVQSSGESSPVSSKAPLLGEAMSSEREENHGQSRAPSHRDGPIKSSDESDPTNSHEPMPFDREEHDGHLEAPDQQDGLAQNSDESSPTNSKALLSSEAMFCEHKENHVQSCEYPVQRDGPMESSDEINSETPLSHEKMSFDHEENDGHLVDPVQQNALAESSDECSLISSIQAPTMISEKDGESPIERDMPIEDFDENAPINSIETPLSQKAMSFDCEENDDDPLEPVQANEVIKSSGECFPINSIQAPLPDEAMHSESEEIDGQSGESPVQPVGPIERSDTSAPFDHEENDGHLVDPVQQNALAESSDECSLISSIQAPIPDETMISENDGETPIERDMPIEDFDENAPINSIETPLSQKEMSFDCEENDKYLLKPVQPNEVIKSSGECFPINSIQAPLPDEAMFSESEENDGQFGEPPVQPVGPIEISDTSAPINLIHTPLSHEVVSFDDAENDRHAGDLDHWNGPAQISGESSPIQLPIPDEPISFDQEESGDLRGEPVQPNEPVQSSPINSTQGPVAMSFDSEEDDGLPRPSKKNGEIQSSGDNSQISSIQELLPNEGIEEDTFYDAVNASSRMDEEMLGSEANRQLSGIQEEDVQARPSLTPQTTQSYSSDSGYETASSLPESKLVTDAFSADDVGTSRKTHPLRVVDLDIEPQTTNSQAPSIPYGGDTWIGEHDRTDGAHIGDNPSSTMDAGSPSRLKNAYMSLSEDQGVTESDLVELMIHPGTSEISEIDEVSSEGTVTSRTDVKDIEEENQFKEATSDSNSEDPYFHAKLYVPAGDLEEESYMSANTTKEIPPSIEHGPSASLEKENDEVKPLTSEYKRRGAVLVADEQLAKIVNSDDQDKDEWAVLAQIEALNNMLMSDSKAPNSNLGVQECKNAKSGKPTGEFDGEQIDFWNRLSTHGENLAKREPDMFAARIEMGVPSACRGKVWMILTESGSQDLIHRYEDLWSNAHLHYESTIVRDVENRSQNRTWRGDTSALRRLMAAYFALDSRLGYCFNLQYLAQILLDTMSEAESLCTLSSVMKSPGLYRLREWYCGEGLEVALYQLGKLMEEHLPELTSHLSSTKVAVGDFAIEWFTSLFTKQAPTSFAIRILDLYFLEGPKFIFKVAIVLLRSLERSLLLCASSDEIHDVLNRKLFQSFEFPNQLIQQALAIPGISESKLEQYEVECKIRTWRTRQSMDSTVVTESGQEEKEVVNSRPVSATLSETHVPIRVLSPSPTPASSMISSGLYSLFARASRRRSEAIGKYGGTQESDGKNATHARTGSASAISGTKLFGHIVTRATEESRDVSTPFSKPVPSDFPGKSVPNDLLLKSEEERARLDAALSTSAAKNVNLANDLLVAQNSLARERGTNSVLRKEINSLQIQVAETEIRASMMEAELELLQSRMDQNELESMRMKGKWDRLMTAFLDG